jgi:hypothetical protein
VGTTTGQAAPLLTRDLGRVGDALRVAVLALGWWVVGLDALQYAGFRLGLWLIRTCFRAEYVAVTWGG